MKLTNRINTIVLGKKTYVVIEQKEFEELQLKAVQKTEPVKKLSLLRGKQHAYKLIERFIA